MENIENNNAVDYIPNRNEIERLVEPVVIATEQDELQQPFLGPSNPFSEQQIENVSVYDATSPTLNNPFVDFIHNPNVVLDVELSARQQDAFPMVSDSIQSNVKVLDEAASLESSMSEKSANDVNSVEEALRALDYAISGEESLLQPNDDEFEYCAANEEVKLTDPNERSMNDETKDISADSAGLYDTDYVIEVREEAEKLVENVIEESKRKISLVLAPSHSVNKTYDNLQEQETPVNCVEVEQSYKLIEQQLKRDCQSVGSVENLCFDNIVLEASTPFIRKDNVGKMPKSLATTDSPSLYDSPVVANATYDLMSNRFGGLESPLVTDKITKFDESFGISPLASESPAGQLDSVNTNVNRTFINVEQFEESQSRVEFTDSPLANATFEVENPKKAALNETVHLDKTFPLTEKAVNSTFTSSKESESNLNCPTIKIDKEDATSVDMTTVTPVNTPIELNYSLDSWDKFITKSMSQELVMPKHQIDDMQPCTSAQAAYAEAGSSGWFLHSKSDGKWTRSNLDEQQNISFNFFIRYRSSELE